MAKRRAKPKGKKGATPIRAPEPENAWDRQPGESAPAYAAFRTYLLMGGERSVRKVAQEVGKNPTLIGKWSSRNRWTARVDAFEAEAARRADDAAMDVLEKRAARQAELATLAMEAMAAPSIELMRRINENPKLLNQLDVDELTRLSATTARALPRVQAAERLARGQSTTNVGGHRGGPLEVEDKSRADAEKRAAEMSPEALEQFLLGADAARAVDAKKRGSKSPKGTSKPRTRQKG